MSDVPWVAWPGLLKDVARVAGNGAAFRLAMELGGTEIHVPKAAYLRNEPDHPIVDGRPRDDGSPDPARPRRSAPRDRAPLAGQRPQPFLHPRRHV
ncbi:MAG: hypothetical protein OXF33_00035 [Rhodospirillales bacterium]|nr:hypothetical protein [Rhodospirillales bacterium]